MSIVITCNISGYGNTNPVNIKPTGKNIGLLSVRERVIKDPKASWPPNGDPYTQPFNRYRL